MKIVSATSAVASRRLMADDTFQYEKTLASQPGKKQMETTEQSKRGEQLCPAQAQKRRVSFPISHLSIVDCPELTIDCWLFRRNVCFLSSLFFPTFCGNHQKRNFPIESLGQNIAAQLAATWICNRPRKGTYPDVNLNLLCFVVLHLTKI